MLRQTGGGASRWQFTEGQRKGDRLRWIFSLTVAKDTVHTGGCGCNNGGAQTDSPDGCCHRAWWRGRKDDIFQGRHGAEDERNLRRRYWSFHRPDGRPARNRCHGAERACQGGHHNLPDSGKVWRFCQDRCSAAYKRGCAPGGYCRVHFSGGGVPDHFGTCMR